ncbi:hypothetical protein KOW79_007689 [Hemibagrus wyckioides]|uniref:Chemokine interleukin-8-like domain-containing protein n=2 Tax=Hemibagrus wyckioides TaxID=337641 RepID=A0A9D3NVH7_9TELE|nr:hypothetical protein KOW79_007689 [Hemibagrus wyckioides]
MRIPVKNIVKYHWTSSDCPMKAIVFDMNTGKKFCVDPTAGWVKNHMKVVDQKNATVSLQTSQPGQGNLCLSQASSGIKA